jgi:hypothetical protein
MAIHVVGIHDVLPLIDRLSTNQAIISINDALIFSDEINNGVSYVDFNDKLAFKQNIIVAGQKLSRTLNDTLIFTQNLQQVFELILRDKLTFIQGVDRSFYFNNTLTFIDSISYDNSTLLNDQLSFINFININHLRSNKLFSDSLILSDFTTAYVLPISGAEDSNKGGGRDFLKKFSGRLKSGKLGLGFGSGVVGPAGASSSPRPWNFIYTTPVTILPQDVIIFNSTVGTIPFFTLRNPSFGNQFKFTFNIIKKETRGRDLLMNFNSTYTFKPFIESFSYTIDYLTQIDATNLLTFLNQNIGTLVELKDYENITWANILITNPEIQFIQKDKNNYSVSFEFEWVSNP